MKQYKNPLTINAHRTEHLYTPVKTFSPMPIGFAGFISTFVDVDPAMKGSVA